ncbi:protein kinase [Achlya hypogyna]|uniref:Protein kinase n=1 Tax=Achlya hypogyna TaxID=1202772 RepID=A0A1V9YBM4_ACHHY|nr:protein kinase [Achlya hypogyna]
MPQEIAGYTTRNVSTAVDMRSLYLTITEPAEHLAQLPAGVSLQMGFTHTNISTVGDLSKDTNVQTLDFEDNMHLDLSQAAFPKTLTAIKLKFCGLKAMPSTIPYGQLASLRVMFNDITTVENLDLRNATEMFFFGNPIKTISNVTLRSNVTAFDCQGCDLTTFLIDTETLHVLEQAPHFMVGSVNVSTTCALPNKPAPLKNGNMTYIVCVSPGSLLSEPKSLSDTKTSTATIVGAIIGAVVAVAIAGMLYMKCAARRSKEAMGQSTAPTVSTTTQGGASVDLSALALIRLDDRDIALSRVIAEGAYGQVWQGTYRASSVTQRGYLEKAVAIKVCLPGKTGSTAIAQLVEEILLTSQLESPCIVKTLGASWRIPSELQMVLEWMDRGDLKSVLDATTPATFSWREKAECIAAMADGLVYLHSLDIIHRDIKSRNVLLDSTKGTKLTDFGVSREATTETMTIGVGTYRWMAPEILADNHYTTAADIYSFGMVLSELTTHHIPYVDQVNDKGHALIDTAIMSRVINGSIKPTFASSCPAWIRQLGIDCIAPSPEDRPSAMKVAYIGLGDYHCNLQSGTTKKPLQE